MLLLVGLAESREKCCAVLGSPGLQQLVAARPTRRRQARAVQVACAGRGGAEGVLGSGEGQCSVVQHSAVQVLEARYQAVVARENIKAINMEAKVRGVVAVQYSAVYWVGRCRARWRTCWRACSVLRT